MEIKLKLGDLLFRVISERDLIVNPELNNYISSSFAAPDITVHVLWDWRNIKLPSTNLLGQDLLLHYYEEDGICFCMTRGGPKGYISCTSYTPDFTQIICTINEKAYPMLPNTLGNILRMLPIRAIFLYFHTLFLHASQVSYRGKGVLFSAPSGIGKTTQARLWQKYRHAEVICNDRTLLRKTDGIWLTYGYPLDGSEPIRSTQINQLGCIVLLEQAKQNHIQLLRPSKALSLLMEQTVMDCWSSTARTQTMELILSLLADIPVYLLSCTPDERAVECLENMLLKEEVIPNE
ncbi:MAG: hypothetical protein LUE11_11610 [Clostridia bacterium]|nr:hypothetical protein [Clostridia bacterium]